MSKHVRQYKTRDSRLQFKPSIQLVMILNSNNRGFCLACANEQDGVEPDARRDVCESCGAPKVYGAEEITLMGLTFDADTRSTA